MGPQTTCADPADSVNVLLGAEQDTAAADTHGLPLASRQKG